MNKPLTPFPSYSVPGKAYREKDVNSGNKQKWIFYFGHNRPDITDNLELYGYRCIGTDQSLLSFHLLIKHYYRRATLPEALIVDFTLTERDIAGFQEAVSTFQEFQTVPLLIVGCQVNRENFKQVASIKGVDDMVASGISAEQLYAKIKFLKKIRMMNRKSMTEGPALKGGKLVKQTGFFLKKMLDIIVSFSVLAVLSPFFLLIAIAIKLESKGPVFYISPRAGNGYRIFRFYKFRTMVMDADKKLKEVSHLNQYDANAGKGPVFIKVSHDPRVTKIGAFLRNTSIDELPQLINVLKGNMSLVGNRPLPLYEASTLTTDQWVERFLAPAGITGLWQVTKRGKKEMSVDERISLDIDYAHKCSFLYDLSILWNTPFALVQKEDV